MHFEKQHGWTIKKMETKNQALFQDCIPEKLDPAPIQDEYAPVIFAQETVSHIVSIDMMSGKDDRENILRARASGKGVLTSPFKLLKSNHLGVVLTIAVYNNNLPLDATPEQRIEATVGYLGASYDVPSLVDKLLHQLASKQTIVVNVYDTTNASAPIRMYGTDVADTGLLHISSLDFGDPLQKHEMHCSSNLSIFGDNCQLFQIILQLAVYASNQVPAVVIGDPKRFCHIITNLVGNSLKYGDPVGHDSYRQGCLG
ncbi:Histidine kinase 2 [Spatholobus suberectus]|nr:Histidine kinase 2 [Spatholobus suberectus]